MRKKGVGNSESTKESLTMQNYLAFICGGILLDASHITIIMKL